MLQNNKHKGRIYLSVLTLFRRRVARICSLINQRRTTNTQETFIQHFPLSIHSDVFTNLNNNLNNSVLLAAKGLIYIVLCELRMVL